MVKKETVNKKEIIEKITPVIENIAAKLNLIVLEVNFTNESGKWFLRIFIYSKEHSISHADCENLTRNIDEYLDELIPVQYYLEVSSPGLERKLKSPKEYNIFKGKEVEIKLKQPLEGVNTKLFQATLIEYIPDFGLKVKTLDNKEIILEEKNITSIKLKADYKS